MNKSSEKQLAEIRRRYDILGMSAAVVSKDSLRFSGTFGVIARDIPVNEYTLYRVASISKPVTATALMLLHDRGLFGLDDDIGDYMGYPVCNPRFPDEPITFRMLLSHTSTLTDSPGYEKFLAESYESNPSPALSDLLTEGGAYYDDALYLDRAPGTWFAYANVNFGLVGTLVEKLSSSRFDIFCKQHILDPLGMRGSFNANDIRHMLSPLYRKIDGVWTPQTDDLGVTPVRDLSSYVLGQNALVFAPHSGLRASALDLAAFMRMHMNDGVPILSKTSAREMRKIQWAYNGVNSNDENALLAKWGLGFHIADAMVGHSGEAYGLLAAMYFDPAAQSGSVFIINGCGAGYTRRNASSFYSVEEEILSCMFTPSP